MSEQREFTQQDCNALPLAQVKVLDDLNPDRQMVFLTIDDVPVARLPVTRVAFEHSYGDGLGYVTLTCICGPCVLQTRSERPQ